MFIVFSNYFPSLLFPSSQKKKKKKKIDEIKIIDVYVIHSLTLHFTPPTLKEFRLAQQKQPP